MLSLLAALKYALQLLGFIGAEVHDAEQRQAGRNEQQLEQNKVDLNAVQDANRAAAEAVDRFRAGGVPNPTKGNP